MAVQRHEDGKTLDWDVALDSVADGFQWKIRLDTIIDTEDSNRIYDVTNRPWQYVGPMFETRVAGSKYLGFTPGIKDVSKNWDTITEEYNGLFSGEIEMRERLNTRNKVTMGRPSQGRTERLQFSATPELRQWLEKQIKPGENISLVTFRLLEELRHK